MIVIEKTRISGMEEAIRGMRNPMNSWNKSDSYPIYISSAPVVDIVDGEVAETGNKALFDFMLGDDDKSLALGLNKGGPSHSKYRRMIVVWADITAPLYWWKEFDTYKVGTVANSCSTMHKLAARDLTLDDFSTEHLCSKREIDGRSFSSKGLLKITIDVINQYRQKFQETHKKEYWWQMVQLLPSSYNQKRTVMMSYEVLANIYQTRQNHKLDEWHEFIDWIEGLEYSDLITENNY